MDSAPKHREEIQRFWKLEKEPHSKKSRIADPKMRDTYDVKLMTKVENDAATKHDDGDDSALRPTSGFARIRTAPQPI